MASRGNIQLANLWHGNKLDILLIMWLALVNSAWGTYRFPVFLSENSHYKNRHLTCSLRRRAAAIVRLFLVCGLEEEAALLKSLSKTSFPVSSSSLFLMNFLFACKAKGSVPSSFAAGSLNAPVFGRWLLSGCSKMSYWSLLNPNYICNSTTQSIRLSAVQGKGINMGWLQTEWCLSCYRDKTLRQVHI